MKLRFLKPAQMELDDAVAWYNAQAAGQGVEFLAPTLIPVWKEQANGKNHET